MSDQPNQFSDDTNQEVLSISSTWKKEKHVSTKSTMSDPVASTSSEQQTVVSSLSKKEDFEEKEVQTMNIFDLAEKMGVLNVSNPEQDAKIVAFLNRIMPDLEEMLNENLQTRSFDDYDVSSAEPNPKADCLYTFYPPAAVQSQSTSSAPLACTAVDWNQNGTLLGASYGRINTVGWCLERGYLCAWNLRNSNNEGTSAVMTPDYTLEVESYLMAIKFHPSLPGVVAGGTYTGEIKIWNLFQADESLVAETRITAYSHKDPITELAWLSTRFDDNFILASLSGDGKLLLWSMSNNLAAPITGFNLTDASVGKSVPLGGSCMSFCNPSAGSKSQMSALSQTRRPLAMPVDSTLIIGTESGKLCTCVTNIAPQVLTSAATAATTGSNSTLTSDINYSSASIRTPFETMTGYTHSVDFNPFHRNLFLSCGSSGTVNIYNALQSKALHQIEPAFLEDSTSTQKQSQSESGNRSRNNSFASSSSTTTMATTNGEGCLYAAQWSPFRPLVFATVSESGNLFLYDLEVSHLKPSVSLRAGSSDSSCAVYALAFNPAVKDLIATGDSRGVIKVWTLSEKLSTLQKREMAKLEALVEGNSD